MVGNRVSNTGFTTSPRSWRTSPPRGWDVHQGPDLPDDLGGQHKIDIVDAQDSVLGSVGLVVEPSVISVEPGKVKAGQPTASTLKGVAGPPSTTPMACLR